RDIGVIDGTVCGPEFRGVGDIQEPSAVRGFVAAAALVVPVAALHKGDLITPVVHIEKPARYIEVVKIPTVVRRCSPVYPVAGDQPRLQRNDGPSRDGASGAGHAEGPFSVAPVSGGG